MSMENGNLFDAIPAELPDERFEALLERPGLRLERILSRGHATAEGEWYDQERDEWVLLLQGEAGLLIEGEERPRHLHAGDYLLLPAHRRHRVEWTSGDGCIWLALHFDGV